MPAMASSTLTLLSFSLITFSLSNAASILPPNTTIHFAVKKDTRTGQYYSPVTFGGTSLNVVVDLGGPSTWFNCNNFNSSSYRQVSCTGKRCTTLKGAGCVDCNLTIRPRCSNYSCGSTVYNPYTRIPYLERYGTDTITMKLSNGTHYDIRSYAFSCVRPLLVQNLATHTLGVIGLSKAKSSLPRQLSTVSKLPNKFALCLPSSSEKGGIFIGSGPGTVRPVLKTPILVNPISTAASYSVGDKSDEYFIGVRTIKIDGDIVPLNTSLLTIDEAGYGGTKLSTIDRYTVLQRSIYRAFVRTYVRLASSKSIVRVAPVRPFGVCFNGKAANGTVPHVNLVLQGENVKWRFDEANLMVKVSNDVMCLGITRGRTNQRTAIVLGGYQLENYLIEFDLVSSNLGFSSLLQMNTTCSHFKAF